MLERKFAITVSVTTLSPFKKVRKTFEIGLQGVVMPFLEIAKRYYWLLEWLKPIRLPFAFSSDLRYNKDTS
jgi:hypothetical protein